MRWFSILKEDIKAATAIEYAFIASLISIAIIAAITLLGEDLEGSYENTAQQVEDAHRNAGN